MGVGVGVGVGAGAGVKLIARRHQSASFTPSRPPKTYGPNLRGTKIVARFPVYVCMCVCVYVCMCVCVYVVVQSGQW